MSKLTVPVQAGDHIQGTEDAPVTLVEYGDYECSYCGMAYPIVKQLQSELGDKLRFVFRNFPLTEVHPHALNAAAAAEAAGLQAHFWEMHDLLYENQRALEDANLLAYARTLHLDIEQFKQDFASRQVESKIRDDEMGGIRSGVNGTPTFYINGVRHNGSFAHEELLAAVQAELSPKHEGKLNHAHPKR